MASNLRAMASNLIETIQQVGIPERSCRRSRTRWSSSTAVDANGSMIRAWRACRRWPVGHGSSAKQSQDCSQVWQIVNPFSDQIEGSCINQSTGVYLGLTQQHVDVSRSPSTQTRELCMDQARTRSANRGLSVRKASEVADGDGCDKSHTGSDGVLTCFASNWLFYVFSLFYVSFSLVLFLFCSRFAPLLILKLLATGRSCLGCRIAHARTNHCVPRFFMKNVLPASRPLSCGRHVWTL